MAKITNRRKLLVAVCAILTVNAAAAADYPIKPIRIIAPFPPASVADVLARPIAQKMAETWGQPVIVDNRAGAAGNVGAELVAKAPPDGYTLLLGTIGTNAVNAALYAKLPYNAQKDFAPVSQVATSYLLLVMHPSVPVRTVKDVIALAKSQPVPLNFGSAGVGTTPYLAGEMFKVMAGVPMTHVAYKGSPQSRTFRPSTKRFRVLNSSRGGVSSLLRVRRGKSLHGCTAKPCARSRCRKSNRITPTWA